MPGSVNWPLPFRFPDLNSYVFRKCNPIYKLKVLLSKQVYNRGSDFWPVQADKILQGLNDFPLIPNACCGPMYVSKFEFSTLIILKSRHRSQLVKKHINICMRIMCPLISFGRWCRFWLLVIYFHVSGVPQRIMTGSGLDDWVYWHSYYNYS
jgi:hypothetical protein